MAKAKSLKAAKHQKSLRQTQRLLTKVRFDRSLLDEPDPIEETPVETYSKLNSTIPGPGLKKDNSGFLQESSNYTIAPAYNKGAYQVIGKNEIEAIGKK